MLKLNNGSQCDPDPQAEMRARIRATYGETWAKHCRDSHRGCCFWRKDCVCECGKCVLQRAEAILGGPPVVRRQGDFGTEVVKK